MTRPSLLVVICGLLATTAAAAAAAPTLRLVSVAPLRIQGSHFQSGERVRATFVGERRSTRTILVGAGGTFTLTFPTLPAADPCSSFSILAVGSAGSHAALRHRPLPLCPPADPP
jgi:hypothetical protein